MKPPRFSIKDALTALTILALVVIVAVQSSEITRQRKLAQAWRAYGVEQHVRARNYSRWYWELWNRGGEH